MNPEVVNLASFLDSEFPGTLLFPPLPSAGLVDVYSKIHFIHVLEILTQEGPHAGGQAV